MAKNTKKPAAEPEPNVALIARDKDKNVDIRAALRVINTPTKRIHLPDPEDQAKPFYHKDAEAIIGAAPHLYKKFSPVKAK